MSAITIIIYHFLEVLGNVIRYQVEIRDTIL